MNRRKAIFSIFLLGGAGAISYSGLTWYQHAKTPDFTFLNNNEALVADLAEVIIPATSTSGAKDVMAQKTIISLIKQCADRKTQNNFINGLRDVMKYADRKFGKPFTSLSPAEQKMIVAHFQEEGRNFSGTSGKIKNKLLGKSFFEILRYYTTVAFCTSQSGANNALAYNLIPGKYISCINLSPGQRAWATK